MVFSQFFCLQINVLGVGRFEKLKKTQKQFLVLKTNSIFAAQ